MTVPERMLYGGGRQDEAVPLRLANYPPVITCFWCFLGAHGSEPPPRWKPAAARRHVYAVWWRKQKQRGWRERPSGSWRLRLQRAGAARWSCS